MWGQVVNVIPIFYAKFTKISKKILMLEDLQKSGFNVHHPYNSASTAELHYEDNERWSSLAEG